MQFQRSMHFTHFLVVLMACEELGVAAKKEEDSMMSTKKLSEDAFDKEHENQEAFLNTMGQEMDEAIGADGEVEVAKLDESKHPCKKRKFLDQVFIHADGEMGSFICKPCHALCKADCSGPAREDCAADMEELVPATHLGRPDGTNTRISSAYARSFNKLMLSFKTNANLDDLALIAQKAPGDEECKDVENCRVEDVKVTDSEQGGRVKQVYVEMVIAGNATGKIVDPQHLVSEVQKGVREANKAVGFLPDAVEKVEINDVMREGYGEGDDSGKVGAEFKQLLLLQDDEAQCMKMNLHRLNSSKILTDRMKVLLSGLGKDHVNIKSKIKGKDFAKQTLKSMLGDAAGDCLEAVDLVVGFSQALFSCWNSGENNLRKGLCSPREAFTEAKVYLKGVETQIVFLKKLAEQMKEVGRFKKMIKKVEEFAKAAEEWAKKNTEKVNGMFVQDQGVKEEDKKCCEPSPAAGCEAGAGAKYKCAGCSSGKMCSQQAACNTVQGMEEKVSAWKDKQYDTFLMNVAEAAKPIKKGTKSTNPDSILAKECKIAKCKDLKTMVTKVIGSAKKAVEKSCPWKAPKKKDFVAPRFRFMQIGIHYMIRTVRWLQWFGRLLAKEICFNMPDTEKRMEKKCEYICVPCCTFVGSQKVRNGQGEGKLKCHTCCHDVCYDVMVTTGTLDRKCCSMEEILQGESDMPKKTQKRMLGWIKRKVKLMKRWIPKWQKAALKYLKAAGYGKKWKFPKLPKMKVKLPTLPQKCPPQ